MLMKRNEVCSTTGLCYTTIYKLERQNKFPHRRQLSPARVAWVRAEVMEWLQQLTCSGGATACSEN